MSDEFKVGDKVLCIKSISVNAGGPQKGEAFTLTSVGMNDIGFPLSRLAEYYRQDTITGGNPNWGKSCFKIIK